MSVNTIFNVLLPVALCVIMLGLGLSLKIEHFLDVARRPKAILVALLCQIVLMPIICLGIISLSSLSPAAMVGMMLLAAAPAGASAVLYTHLADGDTALCLTVVLVNSLVTLASLPLVTNWSLLYFYGLDQAIPLQIVQFLQIFAVAFAPAIVGVLIQQRFPQFADRLEGPVKIIATASLFIIICGAVASQWAALTAGGLLVGVMALVFCLCTFAIGHWVPLLFGLGRKQAIAISMASGIHNAAFVITLAISDYLLDNAEMAIPSAIFALESYLVAAGLVYLLRRGRKLAAV